MRHISYPSRGSKRCEVIASVIISFLLLPASLLPVVSASPAIMRHHVTVIDSPGCITVHVRTSELAEITLERSVPLKVAENDIRYTKANYKIIGLNCVVGKSAMFRLRPVSREEDIVIPVTLRYGNETRSFTYTIPGTAGSELLASQPAEVGASRQPAPEAEGYLLAILTATAIISIFLIALSLHELTCSLQAGW